MSAFRGIFLSGSSLPALAIDRTLIAAGSTGVVAQLSSSLPGAVVFSQISGPDIAVSARGAVTFTAGLAGEATRMLVARAQNSQGDAVERSFTFRGVSVAVVVAPVVTDAGTIGGARGAGLTISGTAAAATGTPAPALLYQWQAQDGGTWGDLVGATGANLVDTALTAPLPLRRRITATNSQGSNAAFSNTLAAAVGGQFAATTPLSSLTTGAAGWSFGATVPVGTYVDGTPFFVSDADAQVTVTPASVTTTGPDTQLAWIHGLVENPGAPGTQPPGLPNTGVGMSMFAGDTRFGFPPDGVKAIPSSRRSPPGLAANGTILNVDPGFTGVPRSIPVGTNRTLVKYVSRTAATAGTNRVREIQPLHVVAAPPLASAFPPPLSSVDKTPVIFWEDVDLSGLPSFAIPATASSIGSPRASPWGQFDLSTISDETPRYNIGSDQWTAYGRDIANALGREAMHLLSNAPLATKEQIARNFVTAAINVIGRMETGAQLTGRGGVGGLLHQYPLTVAVAAWLTRNSARGDYFRQYLSGAKVLQFGTHFRAPRALTSLDWIMPVAMFENRDAPAGGADPRYFSMQPRPGMEGEVWSAPNVNAPGSGSMSQRIGQRDYMWVQFGSSLPIALFLSRVPGGRDLIPYPPYWRFMDMVADIATWNEQFSTDDTTNGPGEYKTEAFLRTSDIPFYFSRVLVDPSAGWPHPTFASPAVTEVWHTPGFELLREISDGTRIYGVEYIVSIKTNALLSRNPAWLPVKESFTVLRNGIPMAFDLTATTGGDARTNGAIQIRGGTIMLFLDPATPTLPGDTITVQSHFAAHPISRPRAANGTLLADFGPITASLRLAAPAEKPNPTQMISMGGYESLVGGVANDGTDPPKFIQVSQSGSYLLQKFGVELSSQRCRRILLGWRGRLAPGGRSRVALAHFFGNRTSSTVSSIYVGNATDFRVRLIGPTNEVTVFPGTLTQLGDDVDGQVWILIDVGLGGTTVRMRVNNQAVISQTTGVTWTTESTLPRLEGFFGQFRLHAGTSGNNPLRGAIREFMAHVETDQRSMGGAIDLSSSAFSTSADWGGRGQNILPGRPDYAGQNDGGAPEYLFAPTLEGVTTNQVPNVGVWNKMSGILNNSNPDQPLPFVQVA